MTTFLSRFKPAKLLALVALGFSLQSASAATYNLGTLNAGMPTVSNYSAAVGSFVDTFLFNITQLSDVSASTVSLHLMMGATDVYKIDSLSVSLANTLNPLAVLGSGNQGFSLSNLGVGDYELKVSGQANGLQGGIYLLGVAVAAVPEPEQWVLLSAGLLALGLLRRRA